MSTEEDWTCSKEDCTLGVHEHSLALVIEHIYGGAPTKSGRNFDREESKETADRILARLSGDQKMMCHGYGCSHRCEECGE